MHCRRSVRWPIVFLLIIGCAPSWKAVRIEDTPDQHQYPEQPAVVLLDEADCVLRSDQTALLKRHTIVKILTHQGRKYAGASVPLSPFLVPGKIRGRTIKADGKVVELDPQEIGEFSSFPDFVLFRDTRVKSFTLPDAVEACVAEYEYELEIRSLCKWGPWRFQQEIPVLRSSYTLTVPEGLKFSYRTVNTDAQPDIRVAGDKTVYRWEVLDLPPLPEEEYMPPVQELAASIWFSPERFTVEDFQADCSTWSGVASFYHGLVQPQTQTTQEISQLTSRLISKCATVEDRIRSIYQWVRSKIHYVAVAIGLGGWRPHSASQVFLNRYGDCKDISALLVAMLREAEVRSQLALLLTRDQGTLKLDLPTPSQFNHAIVAVPLDGDTLWLDGTDLDCAMGTLPWPSQGASALLVEEDGGFLVRTPMSLAEHNHSVRSFRLTLQPDGSLVGSGTIEARGQVGAGIRRNLRRRRPSERVEWLADFISSRDRPLELTTCHFSPLNDVESPMRIEFSFQGARYASLAGERILLKGHVLSLVEAFGPFTKPERKHPVTLPYPATWIDRVTIDIPRDYRVESVPADTSISLPHASYVQNCRLEDGKVESQRVLVWKQVEIPREAYPPFRDLCRRVALEERREMSFVKKS